MRQVLKIVVQVLLIGALAVMFVFLVLPFKASAGVHDGVRPGTSPAASGACRNGDHDPGFVEWHVARASLPFRDGAAFLRDAK